jgi:putative ABC transport system permease protein
MPILSKARSTFRSVFRKESLEQGLDEEMESVLEMLTEEKIRSGMSPDRARREARMELGGVEQVKEQVRQNRVGARLDALVQDCRFAARSVRRDLKVHMVVAIILALGIGATTSLYSIFSATLLRPLPYRDPGQLVVGLKTRNGSLRGPVSRVDYFDYREQSRSFEDLAAVGSGSFQATLYGGQEPELVSAAITTWNLFRTLGVQPEIGRFFDPSAEDPESERVAVISYAFWQRRFGGSREALGSRLDTGGNTATVIGVLPRGFRFLFPADVWTQVDREGPWDMARDSHSFFLVGRLAKNTTRKQAIEDVEAVSANLARLYPDTNSGKGLTLRPLRQLLTFRVLPGLGMLMAATSLLLVLACSNAAGLLLARGQSRMGEMAIRTSLGAPRRRLVRQLMLESFLVSTAGGLSGLALAVVLHRFWLRLLPEPAPGVTQPSLDGQTLLFALALSILSGMAVGMIPAFRTTVAQPTYQIRRGRGVTESRSTSRLRGASVVVQVTVSVVLLIGAGLLTQSLLHMTATDPGFNPHNLLVGTLKIQSEKYPEEEQRALFFSSLLQEIEALPNVSSATLANRLPIISRSQDWDVWPAEKPRPQARDKFTALARWVPPGYFQTMGIPLLQGRGIQATDTASSPRVIVISQGTAKVLFPDQNPLGRRVQTMGTEGDLEVVGVVADARLTRLRQEPYPAMYMSSAQMGATSLQLGVRFAGDYRSTVDAIKGLVQQKDPDVLLANPGLLEETLEAEVREFQVLIVALALFASMALLLTAIGLYGVLSYSVTRRRSEMGIRMSLGASPASLLRTVLLWGSSLVAVGMVLGLCLSLPGARLLQSLLFGVEPLDPVAYASALVMLLLASLLACALPALRAARVDPVKALRGE